MPVVRAIRTMTNQFGGMRPKFARIMEEEMEEMFIRYKHGDGECALEVAQKLAHTG